MHIGMVERKILNGLGFRVKEAQMNFRKYYKKIMRNISWT